jgi:RsiW-degrading membrane proteinase PrsW (M82 family)
VMAYVGSESVVADLGPSAPVRLASARTVVWLEKKLLSTPLALHAVWDGYPALRAVSGWENKESQASSRPHGTPQ